MASSSSEHRSYDVFLSFKGEDVRNNFVDHLYTTLTDNGINTYMDTEELRKGEQISPALMKAIEESRIAIIVFSKDYASSTWCLNELAKIMECKDQRDLMVIPVFYQVEPREVRMPRDDQRYAQAMAKHEVKFEKEPEKVKKWKKALFDAGSLFGEHVPENIYEAGLIQDIAEIISTRLSQIPLEVAKYPVGLDSRVQELKAILNLQSKDDVLMVGLWGQGGVGKTTLAKAIYNVMFRNFEVPIFLENVRENCKDSNGLVSLQKKLLLGVLPRKKSRISNFSEGSQLIRERLCNKRVLIILDDVDHKSQLRTLVGDCKWLSEGSCIIVTTRDKHMLIGQGVDHIYYEVKALEAIEASELFRKHAFPKKQEIGIRSNLVNSVLHYAGGLPLALQVLGSSLCGRGEVEWESALKRLAESPNKEINDVLKLGYEKLEKNEQEIFLDIACFFKGWKTSDINKILDSCDFATTIGTQILIDRTLIREEGGTLQMHDLIQLMGMNIVKEECHDDPSKRSRLWLHHDVFEVLSEYAGTDAIKAIVLKLPMPRKMHIGPNAFTNMRKLRLLILHNVHNSFQGIVHLPNELRWFEWPHCAMTPEFRAGPKKLVGLDLRNSNIERVLKQFKDFKKLKFINFSKCQCLVGMPNLSFAPDLEELNLSGCKNLERAHKSVTRLGKLRSLNLSWCSPLLSLPGVLQSENYESLTLANCSKVQRFPIIPNRTKGLRELDLGGTSIGELPASIENLFYLESLNLGNCKELSILPSSIYRLQNLEHLVLEGCSKLIEFPKKEKIESDPYMKRGFPKLRNMYLGDCNLSEVEFLENPSCFPSLMYLRLEGNNFTNLPACRHLSYLRKLYVGQCNQLQEIREIPKQLKSINADDCKSLSKIPSNIGDVDDISFYSCYKLVNNVPNIYDLFKYERVCLRNGLTEVALPGGEMPEWLIPNNDGYISFMASEDLFKKFLGLVVCVVVRVKEGEQKAIVETIRYLRHPIPHRKLFYGNLDHVWLAYYRPASHLVHGDFSGPTDWRCFKCTTKASSSGIVKMCGFRLIFKPLENDWEVFLRHNPSLNPNLLYEIGHEGSQLSIVKEIPSEMKDLEGWETSTEEDSSHEGSQMSIPEENLSETEDDSSHEGSQMSISEENSSETEDDSSSKDNSSMAGISIEEHRYSLIHPDYRNIRPGGEMPKEFILVGDDTISFMASQDLYDKILGLALCAILGVEDGKNEVSFNIVPYINGQRRNALSGTLGSFHSDHMWIQYLRPYVLWGLLEGGVDFSQFDMRYLQFRLQVEVSGGTMKKLGYVIRCRQLEDDLKFVIMDNQLLDLASLCEEDYEPEDDSEAQLGLTYRCPCIHFRREYLRKCHMHIEEPEATDSDSEPDQMWSGEYSGETD